ncbi:MAG: type II toxin-antitoxin system prevent-host-death family antitoxin [Actinobacteria bacterium]|jgi:prevent-host-death family protein|nr:type II toxin-antitoxin system prevent-host-death family antitoxin [Actinomycetota bacterium]HYZ07927.1 type II toxin-antitoxin system prevent-host-death family antitoxin [Pseudonocardiaceae bacterium]
MDVGVRELKERLSEYLERAAQGEHLTVTERGRPKAVLGPLPGGDHVARGIAEGWITAPPSPGPISPPPARVHASTSIQDMIDEDRAEE